MRSVKADSMIDSKIQNPITFSDNRFVDEMKKTGFLRDLWK